MVFSIMSENYSPIAAVNSLVTERLMSRAYSGVFNQIDKILDKLEPDQRKEKFDEIATHFGLDIKLIELNSVTQNAQKLQRLRNGEVVFISNDNETVAYKLANHNWAITVDSDESDEQELQRTASGVLYLINQQIENTPEEELTKSIAMLSEQYGYKFELFDREEFHQQSSEIAFTHNRGLTWFKDQSDHEVFVLSISGDRVLTIDPLIDSTETRVLIAAIILILMLVLGLAFSTWLWPLWRDHKRLTQTALAFGRGELDARVKIGKSSFASNLGSSFNQMADNIQQLISTNQQLTNAVAHDLRTPLARLRFANEILDSGECTEDEIQRYRKTINSSIDALDYLINQTLLHSRYNRSTDIKHFRHTSFAKFIKEEVDQYNFEYEELEFIASIDHALAMSTQFVDAKALGRALSNLLNNAARHSSSLVRVSYYRENDALCLQVDDDGEGIDEKDFETILQPYSQLNNPQRDHNNGLGLGLAIVYQITKWHKGEVIVSKSDLGGACFKLCWNPKSIEPSE
ncbi:MAG: hypothetical protein JKX81_07585 [Arenicella sp.]|nr:hypothetical protein [Arenicella sp.]